MFQILPEVQLSKLCPNKVSNSDILSKTDHVVSAFCLLSEAMETYWTLSHWTHWFSSHAVLPNCWIVLCGINPAHLLGLLNDLRGEVNMNEAEVTANRKFWLTDLVQEFYIYPLMIWPCHPLFLWNMLYQCYSYMLQHFSKSYFNLHVRASGTHYLETQILKRGS